MNELLNDVKLPFDIGFEINIETFKSFFNSNKEFNKFRKNIDDGFKNISKEYGISRRIDFPIEFNYSVLTYDGISKIRIDNAYTINAIYSFFNNSSGTYRGTIYFNQNNEYYTKKTEEEIIKLKSFLSEKIHDLEKVRTLDDIKDISIDMYNNYVYEIMKMKNHTYDMLWFKNELSKDIETLKRIKYWLPKFIEEHSVLPSDNALYGNINKDKFKLFLVYQYAILSGLPEATFVQDGEVILSYNAYKILNTISDKTISLKTPIYLDYDKENGWKFRIRKKEITYLELKEQMEDLLKRSNDLSNIFTAFDSFKKENVIINSSDEFYQKMFNLIRKTVANSSKKGAKDVDLDELNDDLKDKLSKEQVPAKQNKLKSYIDRVEFYLYDTKPYKVQEGSGIFKNSHILYFSNGTVAIDKLNGEYGYLYIMPITTYFEILNNTKLKNLIEIRSVLTVKPISHKKTDWKNRALDEIKNHSITPEKLEILESISSIILPINDIELEQVKKRYSDNQYVLEKIREKEEERKKKFEEIDKELKKNDYSDYDEEEEKKEEISLLAAEKEICKNVSNYNDFISIYEYDNKIKTRRNPKVSLDTKLRTIGSKGAIVCEMCGDYESFDTRDFETHHIIPLSDNGIDNVYNTVCLCPNCHKRMHSNIPFTSELKWKMLMNVRKNLEKSTPYYVKNFDRLFNPYYNYIYNNNLSDVELLEQYKKEDEYYKEHKEEEDRNFITEWNSVKK